MTDEFTYFMIVQITTTIVIIFFGLLSAYFLKKYLEAKKAKEKKD